MGFPLLRRSKENDISVVIWFFTKVYTNNKMRRSVLALACLLAVGGRAETDDLDDVDRTDFSDPALREDTPEAPKQADFIDHVAVLPEKALFIGANNTLVFALTNARGRMITVTHAAGVVESAETGEVIAKMRKTVFNTSLAMGSQQTYRYLFVPSMRLSPGEYRLVFKAYFRNRDMARYEVTVLTETLQLELAPAEPTDVRVLYAAAAGGVLLLVVAILSSRGGGKKPSGAHVKSTKAGGASKKAKDAATGGNEWLAETLAGSEASPVKKRKA